MTKRIGFMLALIGAVGLMGTPAAFSAQAENAKTEPTSIAGILKAKREAQAEKQAATSKKASVKGKAASRTAAQKPVAKKKATVAKKAAATKKVTKSKKTARVSSKAKSRSTSAANIDRQTTGSIAKANLPKSGNQFSSIIKHYASTYGVPVKLAHAVVRVESNFRPNVTGGAGEIGLMQIKLSTARGLGYTGSAKALYNPETNIRYGMKYLAGAHKLGDGSTCGTILKYNAGHGAKRMNPVSANYCVKVKRHMAGV
ncbi:MAG: lytic transglycosylase domain-containing protein [Phyllobacterium sp.]